MEKWENFFRMYLPLVGTTGPVKPTVEARLPYRVVTLCRTGEAALVEQIMRQHLRNSCIVQYRRSKLAGKGSLTSITIEILCLVSERADLVKLVTRLGLERSVRSVRWESVPSKLIA